MHIETIIAAVMVVFLVVLTIYIKGFKNWLVWAVSEAERALGSGTGQLKLRYVYDAAVLRFPVLAKFMPFSVFSKLVDAALSTMRKMIEENKSIAEVITDKKEME